MGLFDSISKPFKQIVSNFAPAFNPFNPLGPIAPFGNLMFNPFGRQAKDLNNLLRDPLNLTGINAPAAPKVESSVTSTDSFSKTPTEADPSVALAAAEERRRRQAAKGYGSTILTSGLGASGAASTQKKTLLG